MTENQDRRYVTPEGAPPMSSQAEHPGRADNQDSTEHAVPEPALQPPPPDPPKIEGDELQHSSQTGHPLSVPSTSEQPLAPATPNRVEPHYEYPPPAYSSARSIPTGATYPPPPPATPPYHGGALEGASQPSQGKEAKKSKQKMWDTEKGPVTISAAGLGGLLIALILLFSSPFLDTSVGVGLSLLFTFLFLLFSLGVSVWGAAVAVVRLFKNEEDNKGYHAAAILTTVVTVPLTFFFLIMALVASLSIWFGNIF